MQGYYLGDIYEHLEHLYYSLYSRHDMQTSSACHRNLAYSVSNHHQVLLNGLGNQH